MTLQKTLCAAVFLVFTTPVWALPISVVDSRGVTVHLEKKPLRIVSLAPSMTESLFALGVGELVVGVTDFCDWPLEVKELPKVGGFSNPSVEKIVSLRPDLVGAVRGNEWAILQKIEALGIPVFATDYQNVDDIVAGMETLGCLVGDCEKGKKAKREMLRGVRQATQRVPPKLTSRPRVYWGGWEKQAYSAGGKTFIHDLIQRAGGVNIAALAGNSWVTVSLEFLVDQDPEIILLGYMAPGQNPSDVLGILRQRPGWKGLDAVLKGRVYSVPTEIIGHPSPRCVQGLKELVDIFWLDSDKNRVP